MTHSNPGRNDPCPCGSGRKYKHCCLPNQGAAPPGSGPGGLFADLRSALAGRTFDSMEDLHAFANAFMDRRNRAALDDFHGLSPEQMFGLLNLPFDSPGLVTFPDHTGMVPDAPIFALFSLLAEAIGERGLKCTAKGNLPRIFCRDAALAFLGPDGYRRATEFAGINSETDFLDLHVTWIVAAAAGLVRKHKGRMILSRECRRLLAGNDRGRVYPRLFRAFVQRYDWAYPDRYPELPFIQQSFLFTLYLLHRFGAEERPHTFYEDAYLRAFPALLGEVEPGPYSSPEDQARNCYTLRTLIRFAQFLGMAFAEPTSNDLLNRDYRIRKKPLLDETVRFHV